MISDIDKNASCGGRNMAEQKQEILLESGTNETENMSIILSKALYTS